MQQRQSFVIHSAFIFVFNGRIIDIHAAQKTTGAAARDSLQRDRTGGLTSPVLYASGSARLFAHAAVTVTNKESPLEWRYWPAGEEFGLQETALGPMDARRSKHSSHLFRIEALPAVN